MSETQVNTETQVSTEVQNTVETTPAVETTAAPVIEDKIELSKHIAELKRRDREAQAERLKYKKEREAERQTWEQDLKASGIKKLKELGITDNDLTQQLLGIESAPTEAEQLKTELAELKAWRDAKEAAETKAKNDKLVSDYQSEVFSTLEKEGDKFELILQSPGGKELYWNTVLQYYRDYKEAPNVQDLAEAIEGELFTRNKQLLGLKKFAPKVEPKPAPVAEPKSDLSNSFKTLSSRMNAQMSPKIKVVEPGSKVEVRSDYSRTMDDLNARLRSKLK